MPESPKIDGNLREIKDQIEQMRGQLERLSTAIWQDIDHENPERLAEGVRFKQGYNERRIALQETMDGMLALLREYPSPESGSGATVRGDEITESEQGTAVETAATTAGEPIVESPVAADLERKVPFGFVLGGQTYTSASAWPLFYEALLQELYGRDPEKMSRLADPAGGFEQGSKPLFARVPDSLDDPLPVADAFFAEVDMAPEGLILVIKRLIGYLGYPLESFKILLKEKNRGTVETLSIAA
jgi:hypothetical protein